MLKICKTCREEKPIEDFNSHSLYADGHHWRCKTCQEIKKEDRRKKKREYSAKVNPEKNKKYKENGYFQARYSKNREQILTKSKEYNKKNKDKRHERYLTRSDGKVKFRLGVYGPFNKRICCCCKEEKHITNFYKSKHSSFGFGHICKPCAKIRRKIYYSQNKEKFRKYCKKYRTNKSENFKKSQQKHRKSIKYQENRKRRRAKIHNRILEACRTRLNTAVREYRMTKEKHTIEYLGCDIDFFVSYLESKFLLGMSWQNYGFGDDKWNIDHIIPARAFDLENSEEDRNKCFHYTNLQPLWQKENIVKNDILPDGNRARNIFFNPKTIPN